MNPFNRFRAWLWSFLPDKCQMPDCARKGVRGNENRIFGKLACDQCTAKMIAERREAAAKEEPPF